MPAINERREAVASALGQSALSPAAYKNLSDTDLGELIIVAPSNELGAGSRVKDVKWEWPTTMFPGRRSVRTVNLQQISNFPLLAWDLRKHLVAMMLFPGKQYLDLPSIIKRANYLRRLCIEVASAYGDRRFEDISSEQFQVAYEKITRDRGRALKQFVAMYALEVNERAARLMMPIGFSRVPDDLIRSLPSGTKDELPVREVTSQEDDYGKWQPLPDAYLATAGKIWTFYLRDVLPNFVKLAPAWARIDNDSVERERVWGGNVGPLTPDRQKQLRLLRWKDELSRFRWLDSNGNDLDSLPFASNLSFPPSTYGELVSLFSNVQSSLMQLLALLTGGRSSEIDKLKHDCLNAVDFGDGSLPTLYGRNYKISGLSVGDQRSWPIPERVAEAIALLQGVVGTLAPDSKTLWLSTRTGYRRRHWPVHLYHHLCSFPINHKLTELLGPIPAHPHRFRKSIARLAVLALVGAPMILQEIFGHAHLQSVLSYVLANPEIRAEMAEIARESAQEQAHIVAEQLDESGGNGAAALRAARQRFFDRVNVPTNERQQRRRVHEFAEAVIADGSRDIKFIFPGIVCTKAKAANGNCDSHGDIDPSACEAACVFFLALPSRRKATEDVIEWLINALHDPNIRSNVLLASFYRAQLYDQVRIFDDVASLYARDPRYLYVQGVKAEGRALNG